jgi:hypothetical protein
MLIDSMHNHSTCGLSFADESIRHYIEHEGCLASIFRRGVFASQVAISLVALPIIILAGLIEIVFRTFICDAIEAFAEMYECFKNHLIVWIPIAILGIFCSAKKLSDLLLSNYGQLYRYDTSLNFYNREFSSDLNLKQMGNLTSFKARECRFIRTPDVSHNSELSNLSLEQSQLIQAPDVSHNLKLTTLILRQNRLTQSPDVSHNPILTTLDLRDNSLEILHDSILSLPYYSTVQAERNRFSAEFVHQFTARLQAQRMADPTRGPTVHMTILDGAAAIRPRQEPDSLASELNSWAQNFQNPIDFSPLLALNPENKQLLLRYLLQLKETADYLAHGASRQNIIHRTENMLRLACQNSEFKNQMLAIILEGSTACGDKVIIYFNDIEIQWQLYHKNHTDQELALLAIRIQRYELLKAHALNEAKKRRLGDEVAIVLYYQLRLNDILDLPISTQHMLYPRLSGVTREMLYTAMAEIGNISDLDLLSMSEIWRKYLKKTHAADFDKIDEEFTKQTTDQEGLTSQEYKLLWDRIQNDRETALRELTKKLMPFKKPWWL